MLGGNPLVCHTDGMAITKRRYPGRKDTIWGYCFDQPGSTRKNRKQITATGFTTKALAVAAEAKRRLAAGIVHDSVTLA